MSPLRRHIFVCFMAKSAFWVFFGPSSVKRGRTHIVLGWICSVPPPLHTLKIWGAGVYSPRSYGAEFVFLFVHHAMMLGTESLDGAYTHLTWGERAWDPRTKVPPGKRPPGKKSPGQKTPRTKIPLAPDTQQVATYSIAAVTGNWTILV